ncbi:MAG: Gfo/Idh/MocA family oxidoreductase [Clostridia bacterium]
MRKMKIGMVGVGAISGIYLKNLHELFTEIELVGICDLIPARAAAAKEKYPTLVIYPDMDALFADPQIDIVLNLTRPYEHFAVTRAALLAGKHVYSEKPLGATLAEGETLVALAREKGLQLGGAPDTFMGAGIQTCRKLIDEDYIGDVIGGAAFMICRGHESWHPDPAFYYQHGGGPMMDMGPYYLTALTQLIGGVKAVTGVARTMLPQRVITSQPHCGETINVDVPTYIAGILQFDNGAVGTIFTTFDVHYASQARLEIYGTKGTLLCPDPNTFGGPIRILRPEQGEYMELPLLFDYRENSRALGLADMAKAMQTGRDARANVRQTFHVLEIMCKLHQSSEQGRTLPLQSHFDRVQPMRNNPLHGVLDA